MEELDLDVLRTVELDVQKGTLKVNGEPKPRVSYFKLEFDGAWHLTVTENYKTKSGVYRTRLGTKKPLKQVKGNE